MPVPSPRRATSGRKALYPFATLKRGESFTVSTQSAINMNGCAGYWARKLGRKFAVRTMEDGSVGVWRTA